MKSSHDASQKELKKEEANTAEMRNMLKALAGSLHSMCQAGVAARCCADFLKIATPPSFATPGTSNLWQRKGGRGGGGERKGRTEGEEGEGRGRGR